MKKINKALKKVLSFLDKIIITPVTKFILLSTDFVKDNGKNIEKFINNKQTLIVISLIFAFVIFFVVDQNSATIINKSAEVLYNQPVIAEYNEEAYVIEGLPETVDITLIGRKADLYLAKQYPSHEVSVDLRALKPGSHKVTLKYNQSLSSIDYKIDPSTATIMVYEKVSETRELDYDVLNKNNLDTKLIIDNVELDRSDITIKGAEYKLQQVATVKALVDINDISNPSAGTKKISNVPLIAYDSEGKVVDVEIVPSTIKATVEISSPSKEVKIEAVPKGTIAFGKSISSIDYSVGKVTIYGNQEVLDKITSIPVEINVDKLSTDKDFIVNITKPNGVREISNKTVTVKVKLAELVTKEVSDIKITPVNLADNLKVQALSQEYSSVTVIVKGSQTVIDQLNAGNVVITATVDLSGYTVGEYEVPVKITGSDLTASYEAKTTKIKVKIESK